MYHPRNFYLIIHSSSIHRSMGSTPVRVHCPMSPHFLTGSVSGYWDWLWCPGLSPVLMSIAFPFALPYLGVFIPSSSPATELHLCFFFMTDISAPIGRPFTYSLFR